MCNNPKETHHDPTIQKAITYIVRVQVSYCILSEISIPDIEGRDRRICTTASIPIMRAKRADRSVGIECASGSCTSSSVDSAKICGVGIYGLSEREDGNSIVPTV